MRPDLVIPLSLLTAALQAQTPVPAPLPTRSDPVAIAAIFRDGTGMHVGSALPFSPLTSRFAGGALAFDQFEGDQAVSNDFPPVGANLAPCSAAAPSNRLIFGSTVRNVHFVTDYSGVPAAAANKPVHLVAVSWFWNPPGATQANPSSEYFAIDIDWWAEFNSACDLSWLAGPDCITAARTHLCGIRLYYNQPHTPGGHYSIVNVDALNLPPISSPSGAVEFKYLKLPPGSTVVPTPADYSTRAQPYLWGTAADISGGPYLGQPRPGGPSSPLQWNDNAAQQVGVTDGLFTAGECQNYSFAGLCYNPLGPMFAWLYQSCRIAAPFTLLAPPDGARDVPRQVLLQWDTAQAVSGTNYTVEIRDAFDDHLIWQQLVQDVGSVAVPADTLFYCTQYRWKVTASADGDCPSTVAGPAIFLAEPNLAGDFNLDGVVDFFDYLDFVDAFGQGLPAADFNADGTIDFFDYLDFINIMLQGC